MKVIFIRHGKTPGNAKKRYIGRTDEELSSEGLAELLRLKEQGLYDFPGRICLVTSKMARCRETAWAIFGDTTRHVKSGLEEIDFGEFENKNYEELGGNEAYQAWIDSGGTMPFPGGESIEGFCERSLKAFMEVMSWEILENNERTVVFVVHGGTIMALMTLLCDDMGAARAVCEGTDNVAHGTDVARAHGACSTSRETCDFGGAGVDATDTVRESGASGTLGCCEASEASAAKKAPDYFDWIVENGHGYICEYDQKAHRITAARRL